MVALHSVRRVGYKSSYAVAYMHRSTWACSNQGHAAQTHACIGPAAAGTCKLARPLRRIDFHGAPSPLCTSPGWRFRQRWVEKGSIVAERMTVDDFFAGLFAELARRRLTTFSIRVDQFDPVVKVAFDKLRAHAEERGLSIRFRINPHPVHRDSLTVQNGLARAAQRDLISFDNPEYQDIRIKLAPEEATHILAGLPGEADVYETLADEFLGAYSSAGRLTS